MTKVILPFPVGGLSDDNAFSEQAPRTTRDALNVRAIDPSTGRTRGGVRAGLTRFSTAQLSGSNPIKRLANVVFDNRKVSYTGFIPLSGTPPSAGGADDDPKFALPGRKPCYNAAADPQGNLYVIAGLATIEKYNPAGTRIWTFALPVIDKAHLCRAIDVDSFGIIYTGTSSGGREDKTRLWALTQTPENEAEILWEVQPAAYVEACKVYKGRLITLQNKTSTGQAWIVAYDGAALAQPAEAFRTPTSAPSNNLFVGPSGNIYTVAESVDPFPRGADPRLPAGKVTVDWTPLDLTDYDKRVHAWLRADDFVPLEMQNGDDVLNWFDIGGHNRHLFQKPGFGAPTLILNSLGRLPAVSFSGSLATQPPVLTTDVNNSTNAGFQDNQQSLLPAFQQASGTAGYPDNAQTAVFMVIRTEHELYTGLVTNKASPFFTQAAAGGRAHYLLTNLDSNSPDLTASTPTAGRVRYQFGTTTTESLLRANAGDVQATGTFTFGGIPVALDTITVSDGTNAAVLFTFVNGAPANNQIQRDGGATTAIMATRTRDAINNSTSTLNITATAAGSITSLTNDQAGTSGNVALLASAAQPVPAGMVGGTGVTGVLHAGTWGTTISNALIISLVFNHGSTGINTDHPSQFRLNGTVVQEWDMRDVSNLISYLAGSFSGTDIGSINIGAGFEPFRGTFHEILVLHGYASNTNGRAVTYPFTRNSGTASPDVSGDSELERIEGYLAHKYGIGHVLPGAHAFSDTNGPPNKLGITSHSLPWLVNTNHQTCVKFTPSGELKWVIANYAAYRAFALQRVGGIGYGVAGDSDGNIYTMGPWQAAFTGSGGLGDFTEVRKIIDSGETNSFVVAVTAANSVSSVPSHLTAAWSKTSGDLNESGGASEANINDGHHFPRMAVDKKDVVYFPWSQGTGGFISVGMIAYNKTGGSGFPNNRAITGLNGLLLAFSQNGFAAIPDPNIPVYTTLSGSNQDGAPRAEFVWLTTDLGSAGDVNNPTVHRIRLLSAGATTGSPRTSRLLAISNGSLFKANPVGTYPIAFSAPANGLANPVFSQTAQYIDAAVAFGQVFFTDKVTYFVYDPVTDTISEYKATAGRIPLRCALFTFWRGRMVAARSADDGHLWHMSKQADVYNWDTAPPTVTAVQAIDGTSSSRIGRCPDIINAVVDVNDDILLIGCDHSLWQLTGDPQAGGEFDQISDIVGMSFGRGWVKDPGGTVYWFGSRGGVFSKGPFSGVVRLTDRTIERRLQAIDLSKYHLGMEWDYEDEALRLFQFAYAADGVAVKAWFMDAKTGGWWEDQYGIDQNKVQPTSTQVLDGDLTADRKLVYGCEDGFMRVVDRASKKDDATVAGASVPINAFVTHGPVWAAGEEGQGRITAVTAEMSSTQGHAIVELFASDTADVLGNAKAVFEAGPGRNPRRLVRAKGSYAWVKVRSATPTNRWALEHLEFEAHPAGRKRVST